MDKADLDRNIFYTEGPHIAWDDENTMVVFSKEREKFIFSSVELNNESEYFRALLESGMIECSNREVSLPCVSSQGLFMVRNYLKLKSSGEHLLLEDITLTDFEDLLHAAIYLQMSNLLMHYENHLIMRLTEDNIFEIRTLAETFSLESLSKRAESFLMKNISKIWKCESFFLEYDTIESLALLLECDELDLIEEEVCLIIEKFFHELEKGQLNEFELDITSLPKLFNSIRFPLIKSEKDSGLHFLDKFIANCKDKIPHDVISNLEFINERAKSFQRRPNKRFTLSSEETWSRLRCSKSVVFGCGGFTESENSTRKVQFLSTESLIDSCQNQTELAFVRVDPGKGLSKSLRLPTTLVEHEVCVLNGYLYVAGGQDKYSTDGRHTTNKCYRFDQLSNKWTEIASMNSPRSLFYLGALNGSLYAVCGWTGPNSVTKSVDRYDVLNDEWQEVARVPIGLHEHAGCNHKGQLFVSGGYRGSVIGHLNQVWCYDPSTDAWQRKASLSHRRSYHAMASIGDKIYAAGGVSHIEDGYFEDVLIIEVYDPSVDQWSDLSQRLRRPASCMSSLILDTRILLFGGHSFQHETSHKMLQIFDTKTGKCSECVLYSNGIKFFPLVQINAKF